MHDTQGAGSGHLSVTPTLSDIVSAEEVARLLCRVEEIVRRPIGVYGQGLTPCLTQSEVCGSEPPSAENVLSLVHAVREYTEALQVKSKAEHVRVCARDRCTHSYTRAQRAA